MRNDDAVRPAGVQVTCSRCWNPSSSCCLHYVVQLSRCATLATLSGCGRKAGGVSLSVGWFNNRVICVWGREAWWKSAIQKQNCSRQEDLRVLKHYLIAGCGGRYVLLTWIERASYYSAGSQGHVDGLWSRYAVLYDDYDIDVLQHVLFQLAINI